MSETNIKVLFIGGHSRSGSTLLDRMLGQIDGFFSIGELRYVWECFAENHLCSCGAPFRECTFWNAVVKEAFGDFEHLDTDKLLELESSVNRMKYLPQLLHLYKTGVYKKRFETFSQILGKLYRAIRDVSGCKVIIDSSKHPPHGLILNKIADLDVFTVHLVRDSRAVAFSHMRKKIRPGITQQITYMPRHNPEISALRWNLYNTLCRWLLRKGNSYCVIRYEDFVKYPRNVLEQITGFVGERDAITLDFIREHQAYLAETHSVAGNPMRFKTGWVNLSLDDEWKGELSRKHRILVTIVSFPGLLRYKYLR